MKTLLLDSRHAFRSLRKAGNATVTAILTLALGIAANTAVFSAVNAILLRTLPYPNAPRLFVIHWKAGPHVNAGGDISADAVLLLRDHARSFESISAIYPVWTGVNIIGAGSPQYVQELRVSANFFRTLGVQPLVGTDFEAVKSQTDELHAVVLSYAFCHRILSNDRSALGRKLNIDGEVYVVIGVMPPEFRSYPAADVWLPVPSNYNNGDMGANYRVYAVLRSGVTLEQARQELTVLSEQYRTKYLRSSARGELVLQKLSSFLVQNVRRSLIILFGAVLFVLLIACTNVATILIMQTSGRRHEIAVRMALGESRGRMAKKFLLESTMLGLASGLVGLIMAKESLPWILKLLPPDNLFNVHINLDRTVLAFTLLVSLSTALLSGLAPGISISFHGLSELLRQTPRGMTAGIQEVRLGRTLISGQIALTVVLLSGAMILVHGFLVLREVDPGFSADHVSVVQLSLAGDLYRTAQAKRKLVTGVLERLRNTSILENVGAITGLPMERGLNLPMHPVGAPGNSEQVVEYRMIGGEYFSTLGIPLIHGRFFDNNDADTHPVAIINNTLAKKWWPHTSAVGHYIDVTGDVGPQLADAPREVVGVVANVHETGLAWPAAPTVFIPFRQASHSIAALASEWFLTSIVVRSKGAVDVTQRVRNAVTSIDPDLPVAASFPLNQLVEDSLARPRFYALLISIFAALGMLLTSSGLYGLLNYQIGLRTRELAVRIAVGAKPSQAAALVAKEELKLVAGGLVIGIAGALFLKKLLGSMLYGIGETTVGPISIAAILMAVVLLLAGLVIARRVVSIPPMMILRDE